MASEESGHQPGGGIDLREYLRAFRRRRWIIIGTFVVVVAGALLISWRETPIYEGFARIEIQPVSTTSSSDSRVLEALIDPSRGLQTQVELMKSEPVLELAAKKLGLPSADELKSSLKVKLVSDTQIVEVRVEHPIPAEARDWTNAAAEAYLEYRRERAIDQILVASEEITGRIEALRRQVVEIDARPPGEQTTEDKSERDRLLAHVGALEVQRQELPDQEALRRGGGDVINPAVSPTEPVRPNPVLNALLAAIVGAMLGLGLAYLAEAMDDRIRNSEEVEEHVGAPILGYIPIVREQEDKEGPFVSALHDPHSGASEAFRTLRTNIKFLSAQHPIKTILVTSALAGEGKSTVSSNLATVAAQGDTRTILISADLRKPSVHKPLGLSNAPGIVDAMDPNYPIEGALQANSIPNFRLLAAGGLPPNPPEILASPRFLEILQSVGDVAELVVVDSPPVLGLADSSALASRVDGVLLVVDTQLTTRKSLKHTAEQIRKAGGNILGVVLNAVAPEEGYGYYYQYYYYEYSGRDARTEEAGESKTQPSSDPADAQSEEDARVV